MEGTKIEINFMKFNNTTNDLDRGDYFITKYDPTRLYLFLNKKCVVDVETSEDFNISDFDEFQEIQILEKVKITVEK